MDYFKILPTEIILDILTRLPAESVLESKSVCTSWNNLASHHPSFYKMHLHHHLNHPAATDSGKLGFLTLTDDEIFYYLESNERIRKMNITPPFKSFRFIGSCKGLICLVRRRSVCICNPITREYVMLPDIQGDWYGDNDMDLFWMTGFCFVSSTNEFKILRIYVGTEPWKVQIEPWKVHIYTLGSGNGWRKLEGFNSTYCISYLNGAPTFANEALYWMDGKLEMIGTFDFVEEKFCEYLSPPPLPPKSNWFLCHMGVLDGFLYFASNVIDDKLHDLWLLKTKNDDHGMKGQDAHQSLGWSKEFKIDKSRLLAVAKSYGAFNLHWYHLNSCDTKASTSKRLAELKERNCLVIPHKNSLVSLKELGEQDTKTVESVEVDREP